MNVMNNAYGRRYCRVFQVINNLLTHAIPYDAYKSIGDHFIPSKMTFVLQPVKATIGTSFKVAFCQLLFNHVLDYIALVHNEATPNAAFRIRKAITIYEGVKLMASAWEMDPKSVALNGCLKAGILAAFQKLEVQDLLFKTVGKVDREQRPFVGFLFERDSNIAETTAEDAKKIGKEYINSLEGNGGGQASDDILPSEVHSELDSSTAEDMVDLRE